MKNVFIVYQLDEFYPDAIVKCFDSRAGAEQYIADRTDLGVRVFLGIHTFPLSSMRLGIVDSSKPKDVQHNPDRRCCDPEY